MYCSADSSSLWLLLLNLARSKMTFLETLKNSSNFPSTDSYLFLSSSVMFADARTSSASSPRQYSSVLTCRSSFSCDNPEAIANQNCSKRFCHFCHSSGLRKLNEVGGFKGILAIAFLLSIPLLTQCNMS